MGGSHHARQGRRAAATILVAVLAAGAGLLGPRPAAAQGAGAQLVALELVRGASVVRATRTQQMQALGTFDDGTTGVDLTASVSWASSDPVVATVDAGGLVTTVASGSTVITATDPASGVSTSPAAGTLRVVDTLLAISVTPAKRVLPVRRRTKYNATGTFEDGIKLNISRDVDWVVSNPDIVDISADGRARGVAPGSGTVRAIDPTTGISSADSGSVARLTVTGRVTALRVAPTSLAIPAGGSTYLKTWATFEGYCQSFTYTSRVRWISSDPRIATIDREGVVQCVGEGKVTASVLDRPTGTASSATGGDATIVCGGDVVAIRVSPLRFVVPVGEERELRAFYEFADGTLADGTRNVTWTSSDESVIAIGTDGDAGAGIALAPGSAEVVAFDPARNLSSSDPGGANGILDVPGPLESLLLSPSPGAGGRLIGLVGSTIRLRTTAVYAGGLSRQVDKLATWTTSDADVVGLHDGSKCYVAGTARLLGVGVATVAATYDSLGTDQQTASVDIEVRTSTGSASRAFVAAPASLLD